MSSLFLSFLFFLFQNSIEKLNSTPLWNLILQNVALLKVEFNSSYFSLIILYTNMVIPPSGKETIMNKQKHLNLEARILIETMLNEHHSFKSIARELGKDCTTISKEIKAHICFEKTGALGRSFNDCRVAFLHQCSLQKFCQHCAYSNNKPCWTCGRCTSSCISYEKYICPKLSNLPMSVMAVSSVLGVLSKNVFTRHLMLRRNMNRSEVNPVLGLPFLKRNLSSSMMWYLLSSKKGSPFITLRYIMLTNL